MYTVLSDYLQPPIFETINIWTVYYLLHVHVVNIYYLINFVSV